MLVNYLSFDTIQVYTAVTRVVYNISSVLVTYILFVSVTVS